MTNKLTRLAYFYAPPTNQTNKSPCWRVHEAQRG